MPGGYFLENIRQALSECDWFLVVLSPHSLASDWVKQETDQAMSDPRYYNKVIPVLAEPCDWKSLHEHIGRYQLFDYVQHPREAEARLLRHLGVEPHAFVCGNKLQDGTVINSPGMEAEYQQAVDHDHLLIPVGATGYAAREFLTRVVRDKEDIYRRLGLFEDLLLVGRETESERSIIDAILRMIKRYQETV
jgi:hypothetical protein